MSNLTANSAFVQSRQLSLQGGDMHKRLKNDSALGSIHRIPIADPVESADTEVQISSVVPTYEPMKTTIVWYHCLHFTCGSFLAEIFLRSPRKLCIFITYKIYFPDQSIQ